MKMFGMPLELVICDVDGVILDLRAVFLKNLETAALRFGLSLEPLHACFAKIHNGTIRSDLGTMREMEQSIWPHLTPLQVSRFHNLFQLVERENPSPQYPGSIAAIEWMRSKGLPVALCTNNSGETLAFKFKAARVDPSLFCAVSSADDGFLKPSSQAFNSIFSKVLVSKEHTVFIGDWYIDLVAARAAGVPFAAVLSGNVSRRAFMEEGVAKDHIFESLADVLHAIED